MRLIDADAAKEKKCKEFDNELFDSEDLITFLDWCCPTVETSSLWISVEDRLPERSGVYLVCMYGGYVTVLEYSELHKRFNCTLKVTHWMPLPEPPQETT